MQRIVLLGATGYTGTLVAHELVRLGARPLLAGRSRDRLASLVDDLTSVTGPRLETAIADVDDPATVRALVEHGDVLVSMVGPFVRHGGPAIEAAIDTGAVYLDSTGEPAFIRDVVERYGPRAHAAGTALLTAFGHDWVPGNVAGALALREAGDATTRLSIGYFGSGGGGISGGTRASAARVVLEPSYAFRGGRLRAERVGARVVTFELGHGRRVRGVSAGGTEPFTLPALAPGLRDVDVVIGARTPSLRLVPAATAVLTGALRVPGLGPRVRRVLEARSTGSSGGPDAARRARSRSHVVADARDADGALLRRVRLDGPDPYDLTARFLAWGALRAAEDGVRGTGALGPVDAFGLDAMLDALREAGVRIR
ncbi:saccharopine dehydrogenase NADP-binding domain-containing protein [Cellulosimicrobium sp. Marseille-Q4280]|uniref:saccharopine dehydrogenase family protein n=1 Tax=Cellulosimicrobium sp. Marseille-Q4280 TaxID=2937992 RepID=UPI00203D249D|nr:saccharopine dehydrogenase NADP-binding domain-containing protein [Cellulosimicrobium sp. Marseille-Q4280]